MPTISLSVSVAANSASGNVLAGDLFEFIVQPSIIRAAITHSGLTGVAMTADFQIGGESVMSQANLPFKAAFPQFNDDTVLSAGGSAGERLFLNINNTTAGALVAQVLIDVMPI